MAISVCCEWKWQVRNENFGSEGEICILTIGEGIVYIEQYHGSDFCSL